MNLKNKDITEGMIVTNGKDVWKVLDWNSKYTDCLLQKIDKNGNKMDLFVVAENYELYGTEKDPQIAWMNGDYCIEKKQIDALQYFVDFYKKNKIFKERSEENEIIVSELLDTVEYFCGLFEEKGELKGDALKDLKNAVERLEIFNAIGSIYQWGVEVLNKCGVKYKGMKESKKTMNEKVDSRFKYAFKHYDDYEIIQFDDYNYEILVVPNDKSVFSKDLPKFKIEKTYIYDTCVNIKDITLFVGVGEELGWCFIAFDKLANNNNIFAYFISGKTKEGTYHAFHEYKQEYNLLTESKKKSLKESENTYFVGPENYQGCYVCMMKDDKKYYLSKLARNIVDSSWSSDHTYGRRFKRNKAEEIVDILNSEMTEKKSIKESAKPINERNVAKFVDELNKWCDDNIHFADLESAKYTREYGKLYDFEWGWDYSYGDKGLIKVWDNEGTLDWFEETRVKDFIVKLAKKYGWYCECVTNDSDFTFDEL